MAVPPFGRVVRHVLLTGVSQQPGCAKVWIKDLFRANPSRFARNISVRTPPLSVGDFIDHVLLRTRAGDTLTPPEMKEHASAGESRSVYRALAIILSMSSWGKQRSTSRFRLPARDSLLWQSSKMEPRRMEQKSAWVRGSSAEHFDHIKCLFCFPSTALLVAPNNFDSSEEHRNAITGDRRV